MNKPITKIQLVEAVVMTRVRYAVEVPVDSPEWAEDTVVTKKDTNGSDILQMSAVFLDEVITSSRSVTKQEYIDLFCQDNGYDCSTSKMMAFVNKGYY